MLTLTVAVITLPAAAASSSLSYVLPRLRGLYGENFFYMLYFQEPGLAEAELDADPRGLLSRFFSLPDTPREPPRITDPGATAGGLIGRLGAPRSCRPGCPKRTWTITWPSSPGAAFDYK